MTVLNFAQALSSVLLMFHKYFALSLCLFRLPPNVSQRMKNSGNNEARTQRMALKHKNILLLFFHIPWDDMIRTHVNIFGENVLIFLQIQIFGNYVFTGTKLFGI